MKPFPETIEGLRELARWLRDNAAPNGPFSVKVICSGCGQVEDRSFADPDKLVEYLSVLKPGAYELWKLMNHPILGDSITEAVKEIKSRHKARVN